MKIIGNSTYKHTHSPTNESSLRILFHLFHGKSIFYLSLFDLTKTTKQFEIYVDSIAYCDFPNKQQQSDNIMIMKLNIRLH